MKSKKCFFFSLLAGFCLLAAPQLASEGSIYGHLSFIDSGATVLRADGSEVQGQINLPLAPGDTVITPAGGRCELQFDNGTVVRLDKSSRLRLATVLAPSLTSNWEITTLELEAGQLYALPQSYEREMFQVVTPNAAVSLKSRVRAFIRLDADGGTSFFSDGGKFQLLYGANSRSLKKATVKVDHPMAITAAQVPAERVAKRDIEFMGWNEYIDRHFKEMHYGISKVPPKLTKFKNKALTYWAEKWSSLVGEWIYDELFGYVWRPADEQFAYSHRPFFHANYIRINGGLFLVPQELWAWVPAHMGTWVWMKRGWTWIPGGWFHPGVAAAPEGWTFPTLGYYWGMYRYWINPRLMQPEWEWPYLAETPPQKPGVPVLPDPVIGLVKKVAKVAAAAENKRLAIGKVVPAIDGKMLPSAPPATAPAPGAAVRSTPLPVGRNNSADGRQGNFGLKRDWNPDSRWAARSGHSIRYSSARNSVVCPELKVSSDMVRRVDRMHFRDANNGGQQGYAPDGTAVSQPSTSASSPEAVTGTVDPGPGAGDKATKDDGGQGK